MSYQYMISGKPCACLPIVPPHPVTIKSNLYKLLPTRPSNPYVTPAAPQKEVIIRHQYARINQGAYVDGGLRNLPYSVFI